MIRHRASTRAHFPGRPAAGAGGHREIVSAEELGGGDVHTRLSASPTTSRRTTRTRWPSHAAPWPRWQRLRGASSRCASRSSRVNAAEEIYGLIPEIAQALRVREIIARLVDDSEFAEWKARFAHPVTGFAHLWGMPVGICQHGILFQTRRRKSAHFIELCCQRARAGVPAEHHRLHGGAQGRARGHRAARRENGDRGRGRAGAKFTVIIGGSFGRRQLRDVRSRYAPRFLWDVAQRAHQRDGGEQAARVLSTIRPRCNRGRGGKWSAETMRPTRRRSGAI